MTWTTMLPTLQEGCPLKSEYPYPQNYLRINDGHPNKGKYTNFYEQVAEGADPKTCQFITVQDTQGNIQKFSCDQISGPMTFDLDLQGTQSGNQISVTLDLAAPASNLKTDVRASVTYNPTSTDSPIITLAEDVDWRAGDQIVVGSTDYNADNTEVFTVVDCHGECASNQVKLDRMASNTHFGRIDERTGIDQRAAVGLLSRNVRFQGEVGTECQYAQGGFHNDSYQMALSANPIAAAGQST